MRCTQRIHRLLPSVGIAQARPNKASDDIVTTAYVGILSNVVLLFHLYMMFQVLIRMLGQHLQLIQQVRPLHKEQWLLCITVKPFVTYVNLGLAQIVNSDFTDAAKPLVV